MVVENRTKRPSSISTRLSPTENTFHGGNTDRNHCPIAGRESTDSDRKRYDEVCGSLENRVESMGNDDAEILEGSDHREKLQSSNGSFDRIFNAFFLFLMIGCNTSCNTVVYERARKEMSKVCRGGVSK